MQLVLSEPAHAGLDLSAFPRQEIELRGRSGRLAVRLVKSALSLRRAGGAATEAAS